MGITAQRRINLEGRQQAALAREPVPEHMSTCVTYALNGCFRQGSGRQGTGGKCRRITEATHRRNGGGVTASSGVNPIALDTGGKTDEPVCRRHSLNQRPHSDMPVLVTGLR